VSVCVRLLCTPLCAAVRRCEPHPTYVRMCRSSPVCTCVTLRARWVMLRARWVTLRARWGDATSSLGDANSSLG
jgi:hypothetical protein